MIRPAVGLLLQTSALSVLAEASNRVTLPDYDRSALRAAIVHIGVGGFHRAHLATYVDELAVAGNTDWAIVGCGVLESDAPMAQTLRSQDMLYTLITRGADTSSVQVIGSIIDYIHGHPDSEPVVQRMADPQTQIVSLTVTEGGYPVDDISGAYLPDSPNAGPDAAFGMIAAALERRRVSGAGPVTILSCDNIMSNGTVTRTATLGEAARFGQELIDWIEGSVSFPNSMVDRITPATVSADAEWLAESCGINDGWPVVTEPFRQWVVEDRFAGDRLPLEQLDVIVTDDVEPYEFMKLRLLNAGHSCLAYLAALDGIERVDEAMAAPHIAAYVRAFLESEARPVLPAVVGIDIDGYIETLIERFSNPAIGDQISRLCLDGTAKFPKFLLPTVRAQLEVGGEVGLAGLALAGWCQYLGGRSDDGATLDLAADPLLDQALAFAEASKADPLKFLGFEAVFGTELVSAMPLQHAFAQALQRIRANGVRSTIEQTIQELESTGGEQTS